MRTGHIGAKLRSATAVIEMYSGDYSMTWETWDKEGLGLKARLLREEGTQNLRGERSCLQGPLLTPHQGVKTGTRKYPW